MKIYVQSRGFSEKHDYFWIDQNQVRVDEHKLVKKFKDLIQSEKPSLLLVRDGGELLLLVTDLKTSERRDYRGRTIVNSIAWVGEETDESVLRAIAVRALKSFLKEDSDSLTKEIDEAVKPCSKEGFKVDNYDRIKAENLCKKVTVGNRTPDRNRKNSKILKSSDKRARELASELEDYCLPKQKYQEPLIVVFTGIKSQTALEQAEVWRGLSSIVQKERCQDPDKKSIKIWIYLFTSILLIESAFLLIKIAFILYLLLSQPQPKPNQGTQLLPQLVSPSTHPVQSSSPQSQVLENKLNATPGISEIQTPSIGSVKQTETPTSLDQGLVSSVLLVEFITVTEV